jgi:hypothetical protein
VSQVLTTSSQPKFLFRIDEVVESDNAPVTISTRADWEPSLIPNANERIGGGASGIWWYCDGTSIRMLAPEQTPPETLRYKTWSMFWKGGYGYWALDSDAVTPSNSTTGWNPLRFEHDPNDGYSSYLTNAGPNGTLACQRTDQAWAHILLPQHYHGPVTPYQQYGALKGELGIFLGLVAFTMRREALQQYLPSLFIGSQWRPYTGGSHGRRCTNLYRCERLSLIQCEQEMTGEVLSSMSTLALPLGTVDLLPMICERMRMGSGTTRSTSTDPRRHARRSRYKLRPSSAQTIRSYRRRYRSLSEHTLFAPLHHATVQGLCANPKE